MPPLLSVVVPFHDVQPYLEDCLASLAAQTLDDLEVVMVDDGSLDGSALIAQRFAAADGRFGLLRAARRGGPGLARNLGIAAAGGRYLAFADADDVVPRNAYALLVRSLERSGSDLACGAVNRLDADGLTPSPLHARLFRRPEAGTHIRRNPQLIRDRTVWNKVYRRAFWDAHDLAFPAGLYEDLPVAVAAHVYAARVDLLRKVVYHWRVRETGATSITQRRGEAANAAERIASLERVRAFLGGLVPMLRPAFDHMAASWDLGIVAGAVETAEEDERDRLLDVTGAFIDRLDEEAVAALPAIRRLELHLLRARMLPELARVRQVRQHGPPQTPIVRRGRETPRWFAAYPYFGDRARRLPDHLYDVTAELELRARVESATLDGGRVRLSGHACIRLAESLPATLRLHLVDQDSGRRVPLVAVRIRGAEEPETGFTVTVDPAALTGPGPWTLHAELRAGDGLVRSGRVRGGRLVAEERDGELTVIPASRRKRRAKRSGQVMGRSTGKAADKGPGKESVRTASQGGQAPVALRPASSCWHS
ncbi:hypothetical protein Misp01_06620 [Microtetraspora sp. NBRC 13810]|uniref:glycosyltransferase family 2 protein n=1 Tax=Microtetraspora sp. NBRC 13810 TaxID=3030990 RepID=UPI0024A5AB29|nr:glycosyltransferase [Microtetraspora sp. NBRC 13810]GLW05532.1 hypothetical protein Misp01_06620 [Microtetraspora sp. NBRC 13810]